MARFLIAAIICVMWSVLMCSCGDLSCGNLVSNVLHDRPILGVDTLEEIGAGQGIQVMENRLYVFGDAGVGKVVELDMQLKKTGWIGFLTIGGVSFIYHPTGFAFQENHPVFIGSASGLHQIDWDVFYEDGVLDRALVRTISSNGRFTRPEYVYWQNDWYLATTQYDPAEQNEILILDPDALAVSNTLDDPGVIVERFYSSQFIQDLYWMEDEQELMLIQNIKRYSGWRLSKLDLQSAVDKGNTDYSIREDRCILNPTELEGYVVLDDGREIFVTGELENNFYFTNQL